MPRSVNQSGLNLIKQREGFRRSPYLDAAKVWTAGYGHTQGVSASSPLVTESQATEWLLQDVSEAEYLVGKYIHVPLNDNQFSALVCLVFNCGYAPLIGHLGQKLNAKDYQGAAQEFTRWDIAGGQELNGLLNRRKAEQELFLTPPIGGFI